MPKGLGRGSGGGRGRGKSLSENPSKGKDFESTVKTDEEEIRSLLWRSVSVLRSLIPFMQGSRPILTFLAVSLVVAAILTLPSPFLFKTVIDQVLPNHDAPLLMILVGGLLLVEVMRQAVDVLNAYVLSTFSNNMAARLRKNMFAHMLDLPLQQYLEIPTGKWVNRLIEETRAIADFMYHSLWVIPLPFMTLTLGSAVMMYWNWPMALYVLLSIPLTLFISKRFSKRLRKIYQNRRDHQEDFQGKITESIENIRVVRAFAREENFDKALGHEVEKYTKLSMDAHFTASCLRSTNRIIETGFEYLFIVFGAYLVIQKNITLGEFFAFKFFQGLISPQVNALFEYLTELPTKVVSIERSIATFELEKEPRLYDGDTAPNLDAPIRFSHVDLTYPDGTKALKDINLTIQPGETVALIGPSGSGKTSLTALLLGSYHASNGDIWIGEKSLSDINMRSFRERIGMIYQDAELFNRSIRENLKLAKHDATDSAIWHALEVANADMFVRDIPEGLDAVIGAKGIKLSGGQKQRLTIARAVLKDPDLLILDEATSALDSISEKAIQTAMQKISMDRTTLIIAHRLSTIAHADKIVVMNEGEVAEIGKHAELLAQKGLYHKLYASQMDGFIQFDKRLAEESS